jgi:hypothetical protein
VSERVPRLGDLPASPNGVHVHSFGNIDDELDVGVVVVVGATGNLDVVICHPDVVGVGLQILGRGHDCELDGPLVAEHLVGPFSHRADFLDGGNAVVGDQHLLGAALSAWRRRWIVGPLGEDLVHL